MPTTRDEQEKLFDKIRYVLTIPSLGKPLSENQRWIIPCPDRLALADYPEAKKLDEWLKNWTDCGIDSGTGTIE